jgi:hypothetical protein
VLGASRAGRRPPLGGGGREALRELALNLFTIEVSTIVSEGMTARKMPPAPIALIDITGKYYRYLSELEGRYGFSGVWNDPARADELIRFVNDADKPRGAAERRGNTPPAEADPRQRDRWVKRIKFYAPLYWEPNAGWLSNPERRRNNSGSFRALADFAKLYRNYLLLLRATAGSAAGEGVLRGRSLEKTIGEDLPIIDRVYRHSAILAALVSNLESLPPFPVSRGYDGDPPRLGAAEREIWGAAKASPVTDQGAVEALVGPNLEKVLGKDVDLLSNEQVDLLDVGVFELLSDRHRRFLIDEVQGDDRHPWCKQRHWFFGLSGAETPGQPGGDRMMLALSVPVTSAQITEMRKIWETGAERVVMQSVIQMDGDVITRVHPGMREDRVLHELHNQATVTAIKTWMDMFRLISGLLAKGFNALFGLFSAPKG